MPSEGHPVWLSCQVSDEDGGKLRGWQPGKCQWLSVTVWYTAHRYLETGGTLLALFPAEPVRTCESIKVTSPSCMLHSSNYYS